jgi:tetratricopeptide (TPR) repeat protein
MDIKDKINYAVMLKKQGHTDKALQAFRNVVYEDKLQIAGWLGITVLSSDPVEKRLAVEQALRLDPENPVAMRLQQQLSASLPDTKPLRPSGNDSANHRRDPAPLEANRAGDTAIGKTATSYIQPSSDSLMTRIGQAAELRQQGQSKQALTIFRKIAAEQPSNQTAWWGIVTTTTSLREKRQALENILRLDPVNKQAQNLLRQIQPVENQAVAPPDTHRDSQAVPQNWLASRAQEAYRYKKMNQPEQALTIFREIVRLRPSLKSYWWEIIHLSDDAQEKQYAIDQILSFAFCNSEG